MILAWGYCGRKTSSTECKRSGVQGLVGHPNMLKVAPGPPSILWMNIQLSLIFHNVSYIAPDDVSVLFVMLIESTIMDPIVMLERLLRF